MNITGKRLKAFLFLWVLTGFISTPLMAQEAAEQETAAPAAVDLKPTLAGEVVSVDAQAGSLTVKDPATGQETVLATDANTAVSRDGVAAKLEDLKAGEKVSVEYTEEGGKKTAASVSTQK